MSGRELWARVVHRWPRKLAAAALAFVMWAFVSTSDTTTAQRSLLVPITVEGIAPDLVPIGIPEVAEVTVTGPSQRLDRLRPEGIEAILDLTALSGDFAAPVVVTPPQGVALERVTPAEVLGILERVATRSVPVRVVYLGEVPSDLRLSAVAEPAVVDVRGRGARLDRVTQVLVAVSTEAATATEGAAGDAAEPVLVTAAPFPADANGRPVDEVTVSPSTVTITTTRDPILREVALPLRLLPVAGVVDVEASHELVRVVGPPSALAGLDELVGAVALPTERPPPGRYTHAVTIATPTGVVVVDDVRVSVTYEQPPTP